MTGTFNLEIPYLLDLRGHLTIVHHLPGRIRLRFGPALWGQAAKVDRTRLQDLLDRLDGIRDVRLNPAVASVVIQYDPNTIDPENWDTLIHGDAVAAGELINHWLSRYGHLLYKTGTEKE